MSAPARNSFIDRTLSHLRLNKLQKVWRDQSTSELKMSELKLNPDLEESDTLPLMQWMDACLINDGDEVTARSRAVILGRSYLELNQQGRIRFLILLAERYDVNREEVEQSFQRWYHAGEDLRASTGMALREALDPPRMQLLTQFNGLPEGVKFLVDMRAELLQLKKTYPQLAALEADLKRLLISWFDIGLLQLEQISWQSSAGLLEKLIAYEAVHAIQSWDDLKNRLDSDRRCFAFFHPNMPDEPLIFVEVALVQGLADNVQALLDENAPIQDIHHADTAIFYSISNAQKGLAGISFGNFLIKRVVSRLQQEYPQLENFSTLSPVPGFCRWLNGINDSQLKQIPGGRHWSRLPEPRICDEHLNQPDSKEALLKLACHYLNNEKGRGHFSKDPVSHFHLSNGAQIAQLNWMADSSEKGIEQSAGIMVNYLYQLPHIESRSQDYTLHGKVAQSSALKHLLKV